MTIYLSGKQAPLDGAFLYPDVNAAYSIYRAKLAIFANYFSAKNKVLFAYAVLFIFVCD